MAGAACGLAPSRRLCVRLLQGLRGAGALQQPRCAATWPQWRLSSLVLVGQREPITRGR